MDAPLDQAFDRAERALLRIRRSAQTAASDRAGQERDSVLRARVVEVIAELDSIIRDASPVEPR